MLDIRWIRDNPEALDAALARRGAEAQADGILALDKRRRDHVTAVQEAQMRRNAASKEIGAAMAAKDMDRAEAIKAEVAQIKAFLTEAEETERKLTDELEKVLAVMPNVPLDEVPEGLDESGNVEIRKVGAKPVFDFAPKEHFELGEALGQMDFERAAKLSGSRFTVLSAGLARLERALGQFMLDVHTGEHGYMEMIVPLLVRDDAMFGTGQLPKFESDLFVTYKDGSIFEKLQALLDPDIRGRTAVRAVRNEDGSINPFSVQERMWLIPTSEVSLTNLVREEIVEEDTLPRRYTALTPCFRSEAGSAGRDTKGYLRQHQFSKVELVSITTEEAALAEHERMTTCAETILAKLGLHFRTVVLCAGDMGFGAQKTHDIEVWLPGQNAYREISSCSVCGDFQGRRMNARYRPAPVPGSNEKRDLKFVHTLNGSGVAVGRALIAVMENYQNADGTIRVPDVLKPYMGGIEVIS